jgi:hypothetical protein
MKLTLTYVGRFTQKKDGTPLVTTAGRPYTSLRLKANEYGDKYISGFDNPQIAGWKIGDVVEADVETKGEYLNFSVPKPKQVSAPDINRVEVKLDRVLAETQTINGILTDMRRVLSDLLSRNDPDFNTQTDL